MNKLYRTLQIKLVHKRIGWQRNTIHRRGKKFNYGYYRNHPKLNVDWTVEGIVDLPPQLSQELYEYANKVIKKDA